MTSQVIENITEDDEKALGLMQPSEWGDIVPLFKFYASKEFCRPLAIRENSQIVGVGTAIFFEKTAWLAHIIVREDKRNKGFGKKILDDLLETTFGCESVSLIATELGLPLYEKAGFREVTEYVVLESEKATGHTDSAPYVRRLSRDDIKGVLALDEKISGEKRSELLLEKLCGGIVHKPENHLRGYFLPGLGEGLIFAEDDEAGEHLMKYRMSVEKKAVLPRDNVKGIDCLASYGFSKKKRVKRMIYGKEFPWHPEMVWNRIGGNFG
ncbi:GNAT family N-acetyltransferase [candidate division WOR-3 bacterium]|nr:GNAT family N-acetyltransferase [candidate division WOR-3 bacterium]